MSATARLHPEDVEAIARRTAELVLEAGAPRPTPALLTAAEVARRFGVTPAWVREHADELGAVRLGDGPRGRLRFDRDKVAEALAARPGSERSPVPDRPLGGRKSKRARPVDADGCPLLPIRGREAVE